MALWMIELEFPPCVAFTEATSSFPQRKEVLARVTERELYELLSRRASQNIY